WGLRGGGVRASPPRRTHCTGHPLLVIPAQSYGATGALRRAAPAAETTCHPPPPTTAGRRPGRGRADRRGLRGLPGPGPLQVDPPVGVRAQVGAEQELLPVLLFPVVGPVLDLAVPVPARPQGIRQLLELYGRRHVVPAFVGEQDDLAVEHLDHAGAADALAAQEAGVVEDPLLVLGREQLAAPAEDVGERLRFLASFFGRGAGVEDLARS